MARYHRHWRRCRFTIRRPLGSRFSRGFRDCSRCRCRWQWRQPPIGQRLNAGLPLGIGSRCRCIARWLHSQSRNYVPQHVFIGSTDRPSRFCSVRVEPSDLHFRRDLVPTRALGPSGQTIPYVIPDSPPPSIHCSVLPTAHRLAVAGWLNGRDLLREVERVRAVRVIKPGRPPQRNCLSWSQLGSGTVDRAPVQQALGDQPRRSSRHSPAPGLNQCRHARRHCSRRNEDEATLTGAPQQLAVQLRPVDQDARQRQPVAVPLRGVQNLPVSDELIVAEAAHVQPLQAQVVAPVAGCIARMVEAPRVLHDPLEDQQASANDHRRCRRPDRSNGNRGPADQQRAQHQLLSRLA